MGFETFKVCEVEFLRNLQTFVGAFVTIITHVVGLGADCKNVQISVDCSRHKSWYVLSFHFPLVLVRLYSCLCLISFSDNMTSS